MPGSWLVEFCVENSHEDQYQEAYNEEDRERDIADNPGMVSYCHVDINKEKPHPTGDEKHKTYNHHEEKYHISTCYLMCCGKIIYGLRITCQWYFSYRVSPEA